jgi:hypothetical protein
MTKEAADKVGLREDALPQRLKPDAVAVVYGRAEARPLHQGYALKGNPIFFRSPCRPALVENRVGRKSCLLWQGLRPISLGLSGMTKEAADKAAG